MTNESKPAGNWEPKLSEEVLAGVNAAIHAGRDLEQIDAAIGAIRSHPEPPSDTGPVLPGGATRRNVGGGGTKGSAVWTYGRANSGMARSGSGIRVRIAPMTGSHRPEP